MNTPERNFWNMIQPMLHGHVQRLESAMSLGVPDVNICWNGNEYWLELKAWVPGPGIILRKEQWAWMNRRIFNGGKCFVACYSDEMKCMWFAPTNALKVKPYGIGLKYVEVKNPYDMAIVDKTIIKSFLKTNLFTTIV